MKYRAFTLSNFRKIPQINRLSEEEKFSIEVVGSVLPFKTCNYVIDELIDWDNYRDDPFYILNFPQKEMLSEQHFNKIATLLKEGVDRNILRKAIDEIRLQLNPNPAGQEHNVPELEGEKLNGIQHKYSETMLFFPSQGQTCHAYCTFCFRWPQFALNDFKFSMNEAVKVVDYLKAHPEITDILFTGGDPGIMRTKVFEAYLNAIIEAKLPNLRIIRIGTKSLSYWPYRFSTDEDAEDLLKLFKKVADHGIQLCLMAHFNHPRALTTPAVKEAVANLRAAGVQIRSQSPQMAHINDDPGVWADMWKQQVSLGIIPYYMFIARDTGPRDYFAITLENAWKIFRNAYKQVSGICRTVRGPSMSAMPGKVCVNGIAEVKGEKVFVLSFIQGRNSDWVGKPFFAKYNPDAVWLDDLEPAFGEDDFFYKKELVEMMD